MRPRVKLLYDRVMDPANRQTQRGFREYGRVWGEEMRLSLDSYLTTEGEPMVIRHAKAFAHTWSNRQIPLQDHELLVGTRVAGEPDTELKKEFAAFWRGKTESEKLFAQLTPAERAAKDNCLFCLGGRHLVIDFARVLTVGLEGIMGEVHAKMKDSLWMTDDKRNFYAALLIVLKAMLAYAERYAAFAEALAGVTADAARQEELREIARICRRVPRYPARTFHEALQSVWFVYMMVPDGLGRFDQYLYPYYQADLAAGRAEEEDLRELVQCFWLKVNELVGVYNYSIFNMTLGGVTPDGKDASNSLTYLCLDVLEEMGLINPGIAFRCHAGTPPELLRRACEIAGKGLGSPAFYHDELTISMLQNYGISLEDARDYAICGCAEIVIPGKSNMWACAGYINLLKCLELALNNGVSFLEEKPLGLPTGEAAGFFTFEQLWEAFQRQVMYAAELLVQTANKWDKITQETSPNPVVSALMTDCIERGLDYTAGGVRYNATQTAGLGVANVADALVAIKKYVYERQELTLEELTAVLRKDFAGAERLRQTLVHKFPKYGNDEEEVDELARRVANFYLELIGRYQNLRGGPFVGGAISWFSYRTLGNKTGASADGRFARQPLAESINPAQGRDKKGPTAVLQSAAKIDQQLAPGTMAISVTLPSTANHGEHIAGLVRGYFAMGGMQLQINVLDRATLQAARAEPEKYRHLIVRVAGFSAYFVTLSPEVQDEIIARTGA